MIFLLSAISFMLSISMQPLIIDALPCKDVIDIYYIKELENLAYDSKCPFTKTQIECRYCGNFYISRKGYKRWAKDYEKINDVPSPFPKRRDMHAVLPPVKPGK